MTQLYKQSLSLFSFFKTQLPQWAVADRDVLLQILQVAVIYGNSQATHAMCCSAFQERGDEFFQMLFGARNTTEHQSIGYDHENTI